MHSITIRCALLLTSCLSIFTFALVTVNAQSTLLSVGKPTGSVTIPVEDGFINLADGNLHIDIPFATQAQRGSLTQHAGFVYDSGIWHGVATANGNQWMPTNIVTVDNAPSMDGWRYVAPIIQAGQGFYAYETETTGSTTCSSNGEGYIDWHAFTFNDQTGTQHVFPIETIAVEGNTPGCVDGHITDTPSGQNYATDGSGYYATVINYSEISIWDPSGNEILANGGPVYQDPNGNYFDLYGFDDRNQQDVTVTQDPSNSMIYYYDVLTTYAKTVRYTVTLETIQLSTNFLADSVGSDFTGSITTVKSIELPDGSAYGFTYENGTYGELTGITLPTGGSVSYEYTSGLNGTRAGENVPPRWVSQHVGANGTTNFSILPTSCDVPNSLECYFLDNYATRSGSTVDYTFGLKTAAGFAYLNTEIQTYVGANNQTALESTTYKAYDFSNSCPAWYCSPSNPNSDPTTRTIWPNFKATTTTLANGQQALTLYNTFASPGSGIPLDVEKWDYYTPVTNGPYSPLLPSGPASSVKPTRRSISTVSEYMNGVPLIGGVQQYDVTGAMISQTTNKYDESAYMSASSGISHHNVVAGPHGGITTTTEMWNTQNSTLTQHFYHDDTGSLLASVDAKNNKTSFTYDPTDTFVTQTTYPPAPTIQLITKNTYDASTGQVLTSTDANNNVTHYAYDSLGRPSTVEKPESAPTVTTTTTYPSPNEVDVSDLQSSGTTVKSVAIIDGFGRSTSKSLDTITTNTSYDSQGRVYCEEGAHGTSTSSTDGYTCRSYDTLDRVTSISEPDSSKVTVTYLNNTVKTKDELNQYRMSTYNAFDQLSSVSEPDAAGSLNWLTAYQYNGLGEVSEIDQEGGTSDTTQWRTRKFSYDSLGQMSGRSSPEAGSDAFTYDNNGNLLTVKNANGATVTYTYDALNRMQTKSLSSGPAYTYVYDAQDKSGDPNGKGALTSAANGTSVGFYMTHDNMGRLASEHYCLPSGCAYTASTLASYDYHGNPTSLTYPDGRTLTLKYDLQDRLVSNSYTSWNGTALKTAVPYFSGGAYYAPGELNTATYGNGVALSATYTNRQLPQAIAYTRGIGNVVLRSKSYSWATNGQNLLTVTDGITSGVRTFTYDPLNRIKGTSDNGSQDPVIPTGSGTVSGTEKSKNGTYDTGTVQLNIQNNQDGASVIASASYGSTDTPSTIAAALAAQVNQQGTPGPPNGGGGGAPSNPGGVSATASGGVLNMMAYGPSANQYDYPMYVDVYSDDPTDFPTPSFSMALSGTTFSSGTAAPLLNETYTPDAWGNLQQSGNFNFGSATSYGKNNQISQTGFAYDTAGNLTQSGTAGQTVFAYDAESKVTTGYGAVYTYDPLSNRVRKDNGSNSLEYYYFGGQLLATRNPSSLAWNDYIYAGNGLIAENVGTQSALPTFRLGDHLDSLAETTDSMGDPAGTNDFTPYGQVVQGTAQSLIQFTDHESDSESGTDHTLYRQFSPAQSRWTRPDPANSSYNLYDPQSFNRYAYLSNRPNNGVDALGLDGGNGCGLVCTIGVDAGIGAIIAGFEGVFGGGGHSDLPGVQTAPSTTDTTASDSSTAGAGSDGDPAWDKPILNEQLGLPPNIAAQLGSGGFLGALGLGSDSCEFGACGPGASSFQAAGGAIAGTIVCQFAEPCGAIEDSLLVIGAIGVAGYDIYQMSQHGRGNQADTGIEGEAHQLIAQGVAAGMCAALDILMGQAKAANNSPKQQRIKKTQKAYGCRQARG